MMAAMGTQQPRPQPQPAAQGPWNPLWGNTQQAKSPYDFVPPKPAPQQRIQPQRNPLQAMGSQLTPAPVAAPPPDLTGAPPAPTDPAVAPQVMQQVAPDQRLAAGTGNRQLLSDILMNQKLQVPMPGMGL